MVTTAAKLGGGPANVLDRFPYKEIWCCDFEFFGSDGNRPTPVCMVAQEARSGRTLQIWQDELAQMSEAPFDTGPETLFVAYFASAEIGCFLTLRWDPPERILDLFTEFRAETNGLYVPHGNSLLGALAYFGLPTMEGAEKAYMRDLILSGGPWSGEDQRSIMAYCQEDVSALLKLLVPMTGKLFPLNVCNHTRLGHALLRGRYMTAVAHMEHNGVPIDVQSLSRMEENWDPLKLRLIEEVDKNYGFFEGKTFKRDLFEKWLVRNQVPWPRLASGSLALDDGTFRQMANGYPEVAPLRELRHTLSGLRLNDLQVGSDGRNRCLLSPFRSKTGRNQPSNSKFIFGPSRWLRGLIKPAEGHGIAYLDFGSQEIAIAAALSNDPKMKEAYSSGDPYLSFAKQAGLAPQDATKDTHKAARDRCKAVVLGVGYGMGAESLAQRTGLQLAEARALIQRHRETYRTFWEWAENNVNIALAGGELTTVFGWPRRCGPNQQANSRSLLNFPMQANGAEMLRLAACLGTEAGLKLCAPIHDALLLEAPLDRLDEHIAHLKALMIKASEVVMGTLACRVDADIVRYPDRYSDDASGGMWDKVSGLLQTLELESVE
jgi:DNA polymerase I